MKSGIYTVTLGLTLWLILWVILGLTLGDYRVDLGLYGDIYCDWILGLSLISGLGENSGVDFRVMLRVKGF